MLASGLFLAVLFALGMGTPVERNLRVHESRPTAPTGFLRVGSADATTVLNLRLGLVSNNVDKLVETLYDVSTPSSANYGQHLSKSEVSVFMLLLRTNVYIVIVGSGLPGSVGRVPSGGERVASREQRRCDDHLPRR